MKKLAFYDTKNYDKVWFDKLNNNQYEIEYFENKLDYKTAELSKDADGVIAFVNDNINDKTIEKLHKLGIKVIALRCAGYNNVDFKNAYNKIHVLRVPEYSAYSVAEHTIALILSLNRKIHKAYNRTREFNFSLDGLIGFDLKDKTIGIIGTGKIGKTFSTICKGFGMKVLAYDLFPSKNLDLNYVSLDELFKKSDIISLHCPLTKQTNHIIDKEAIRKMKRGVYIINTSRGALIDSNALLSGLKSGKIGAAGLDVYEEEAEIFFEDFSNSVIRNEILTMLVSMPNVVITSHQAFLTQEALKHIAEITLKNLDDFFAGNPLKNEICYNCQGTINNVNCDIKMENGNCF